MRKLDNYGTFFVGGLGIGAAVSLATLAITLDVLLAFRAFIFLFAMSMAVAVVLTLVSQDEIREVEQNLLTNNVMRERLQLISQARGLGITNSHRPERVQEDVQNTLGDEYGKLQGSANN